MDNLLRKQIHKRSGGRCEAVIIGKVDSRCSQRASQIHHMLTKARGGVILDDAGEIYHLLHLCHTCHSLCDGKDAYDGGVLIDGYVRSNKWGKPVYYGTDKYLNTKYGEWDGN